MTAGEGGGVLGVVSPHLDDAVLSCALYLIRHPGSHVVTVFAGGPAVVDPLTEWDVATGAFRDGDDVVGARRAEDAAAARIVGAQVHHLDFWDEAYRGPAYGYDAAGAAAPSPAAIATALGELAAELRVDAWLLPLGLGHGDHRLAAEGGLRFARDGGGDTVLYCYHELPYALERPSEALEAVASLRRRGFGVEGDLILGHSRNRVRKALALSRYASQRAVLGRRVVACLWRGERICRLLPPDHGRCLP